MQHVGRSFSSATLSKIRRFHGAALALLIANHERLPDAAHKPEDQKQILNLLWSGLGGDHSRDRAQMASSIDSSYPVIPLLS